MYVEPLDLIRKNKGVCIAFAVIVVFCLTGAWLAYDYGRNTEIYDCTDGTLGRIESGVESAGKRIAESERRVETAEKTIGTAVKTIERSEGAASEIAGGIEACERRLDDCIQRSGRIKNILSDIETEHGQREAGSQAPALAK